MALVLSVQKSSISADCTIMTITDNSGTYPTPLTGYGAPNETRANLYIKLIVTLKLSAGDVLIDVPAYNENTAASWDITIDQDGWYEIFTFSCRAWNSGTTYSLGHIAYDAGTDKFYKSAQNVNLNHAVSDTAWWSPDPVEDDFVYAINQAQPNTYSSIDNVDEVCNSNLCFARKIAEADCCDCSESCEAKDYEKIRWKIEQVQVLGALGEHPKAQQVIETIQAICDCSND